MCTVGHRFVHIVLANTNDYTMFQVTIHTYRTLHLHNVKVSWLAGLLPENGIQSIVHT